MVTCANTSLDKRSIEDSIVSNYHSLTFCVIVTQLESLVVYYHVSVERIGVRVTVNCRLFLC